MNAPRLSTILMCLGYPILFAVFFVEQELIAPVAFTGAFIAAAAAVANYCGD